jgi:hypothetical protein
MTSMQTSGRFDADRASQQQAAVLVGSAPPR